MACSSCEYCDGNHQVEKVYSPLEEVIEYYTRVFSGKSQEQYEQEVKRQYEERIARLLEDMSKEECENGY